MQFALVSVYLQEYVSMVSYHTAMTVVYRTCTSFWLINSRWRQAPLGLHLCVCLQEYDVLISLCEIGS